MDPPSRAAPRAALPSFRRLGGQAAALGLEAREGRAGRGAQLRAALPELGQEQRRQAHLLGTGGTAGRGGEEGGGDWGRGEEGSKRGGGGRKWGRGGGKEGGKWS